MRITAASRNYRRGLRGCTALVSAATLTAMIAVVATDSTPAQAALSLRPDAITPNATSYSSTLEGVSAVSATDAWAAGWYLSNSGADEPLIEHWNGTAWTKMKSATPRGAQFTNLYGVSAVSPTDAWAAGYYTNGSGAQELLLLQCNGTVCRRVPTTLPGGAAGGDLYGVSADSATDAWAAGYYQNSSGVNEPLILHWNGTAWKKVKSTGPIGAQGTHLFGVSAVSPKDAWMVGQYTNSSGAAEPLIMRCDGKTCKQVPSPAPSGATAPSLNGVSAASATDAWAAGRYDNSSGVSETLVLHWNGKAWKQVASPTPTGAQFARLGGVSAVPVADGWAVGSYENSSGVNEALLLQCTGKTCKQADSPAPGGAQYLSGVSADSAKDAWAVGQYESSAAERTLTLHWNGTAWKQVKSPNGA
jgi:hypothetical protein